MNKLELELVITMLWIKWQKANKKGHGKVCKKVERLIGYANNRLAHI